LFIDPKIDVLLWGAQMRRSDREVKDSARIDEIIRMCDCCRLGLVDGDGVYIVPLNFGFKSENGRRTLYFHGAKEGKKIELIKAHPFVGFELDTNHAVTAGEKACDYSFIYSSVIVKVLQQWWKTLRKRERPCSLSWNTTQVKAVGCCLMRQWKALQS